MATKMSECCRTSQIGRQPPAAAERLLARLNATTDRPSTVGLAVRSHGLCSYRLFALNECSLTSVVHGGAYLPAAS